MVSFDERIIVSQIFMSESFLPQRMIYKNPSELPAEALATIAEIRSIDENFQKHVQDVLKEKDAVTAASEKKFEALTEQLKKDLDSVVANHQQKNTENSQSDEELVEKTQLNINKLSSIESESKSYILENVSSLSAENLQKINEIVTEFDKSMKDSIADAEKKLEAMTKQLKVDGEEATKKIYAIEKRVKDLQKERQKEMKK